MKDTFGSRYLIRVIHGRGLKKGKTNNILNNINKKVMNQNIKRRQNCLFRIGLIGMLYCLLC